MLDKRTIYGDFLGSAPGPGDRWRLFAIAACGCLVMGHQEVALYAARLRARRAGVSNPTTSICPKPQHIGSAS
jgi:hypothetical protein